MKKILDSELLLYPCPITLVTSQYNNSKNVLTVSWTGIASSHPEYVTISVKATRYSYELIHKSGFFTINVINKELLQKADYCGSHSGRNRNKFDDCGFSCVQGIHSNVPMIAECPVNIECSVIREINLGSHILFLGKVLGKYVDEGIAIQNIHEQLSPVVYFRPNYYAVDSDILGSYGKMSMDVVDNTEK